MLYTDLITNTHRKFLSLPESISLIDRESIFSANSLLGPEIILISFILLFRYSTIQLMSLISILDTYLPSSEIAPNCYSTRNKVFSLIFHLLFSSPFPSPLCVFGKLVLRRNSQDSFLPFFGNCGLWGKEINLPFRFQSHEYCWFVESENVSA